MKNYRRVEVNRDDDEETQYEGWFLGFGIGAITFNDGSLKYNETMAIIEKKDGTVNLEPLNYIKFLDT